MKTRIIGNEQVAVSALGLGCMGMSQAYGPAEESESIATIHRAIEAGMTMIDTAISYGRGHNEQLVGRAIADRRDAVTLATKFGIVRGEDGVHLDASAENARACCEASLRNLGVDHIDLYYLHRVDPEVPVEESIGAMAELAAEGKIGHIGISEANVDSLQRAAAVHPITALQSEWSLWTRDIESEILPAARRLGIGVVAHTPLGQGFLTGLVRAPENLSAGDFRRRNQRFQGEHFGQNLELLREVEQLAAERGATAGQVALAWLLAQGDDVVAIPGTKHPQRVNENVAAADIRLSASDLERLEEISPEGRWAGEASQFGARQTSPQPS
jgi:aryl-alcohol dehydrogenase-like predicted oxidoreductase